MLLTRCLQGTSIFALSFLMLACGGGSDTEPSQVIQAPVIVSPPSVATIDFSLPETVDITESSSQSIILDINYSSNLPLSVSFSETPEVISFTVNSRSASVFDISIQVADVSGKFNEENVVDVSVTDGAVTATHQISLRIINQSLNEKLATIEEFLSDAEDYSYSSELTSISNFVADKGYLTGALSHQASSALQNSLTQLAETITHSGLSEFETIYKSLLSQKDSLTETEFDQFLSNAQTSLSSENELFFSLLTDLNSTSISNLPKFQTLYFSHVGDRFSLFYGNANYGTWADESWVFKSEWAFLERILSTQNNACSVDEKI
ncbi:hypothetical protein [Paraglaciecola sp.]|uniref:hypothetical protein n=1 Tax=Paraglaciecola sp. TaxID=1920173 RepID=UPI00273CFC86|nr:hypothetical protein [Paraglaciecola sp.]MDP5031411.1 hypothetical protein [Paraglaciecola sp.]